MNRGVRRRRGFPRRLEDLSREPRSAQELKHALLGLVGERERGDRDRLAGRQRLAVGRFLVGVGQGQVGRTGLQHVDQVLVEVLTDLHDGQVRTQGGRLGAEHGAGRVELGELRVGGTVVQEVGARGQRGKAEAGRVEGDTVDGECGLGGFIEGQLEVVAIQQIDTVEGQILRGCRDLRDDVVVLAHQAGANCLRSRIGGRCGYSAERRGTGRAKGNRTDRGRKHVVARRGEDQIVAGVEAGGEVVGRQSGVELGERRGGAEGEAGRRAATSSGDGESLAGLDIGAVDQVGRGPASRSAAAVVAVE